MGDPRGRLYHLTLLLPRVRYHLVRLVLLVLGAFLGREQLFYSILPPQIDEEEEEEDEEREEGEECAFLSCHYFLRGASESLVSQAPGVRLEGVCCGSGPGHETNSRSV